MDLSASLAPKSDQLNAEDLLTGPRTFTIEKVTAGTPEQPFNFHLVELPGRPYRPSKTMRRIMAAAWGTEGSAYAGKRLTLYRDPEITFGPDKVGGIVISHLSNLQKRLTVSLTVRRGKRAPFNIDPLPEPKPAHIEPAAAGVVSDKVKADTAKAIAEGTVAGYLDYLNANNAPQHVIDYVTTTAKEPTA